MIKFTFPADAGKDAIRSKRSKRSLGKLRKN
jgi:hypothetical protein